MQWLATSTEALGFWAAVLTTLAFTPQVVRTWRIGGKELSWLTLSLFGSGVGLWFVYGFLRGSAPLMLANGLTGLQVLVILVLKVTRSIEDIRPDERGWRNTQPGSPSDNTRELQD